MKRTIFILVETQKAEDEKHGGITHEDTILHGAFTTLEDCKEALKKVAEMAILEAIANDYKEVCNYYRDNLGAHLHYVERFSCLIGTSDFVTKIWRIKIVSLEEPD